LEIEQLTVHFKFQDDSMIDFMTKLKAEKTGDCDRRLCFSSGTTAIHANPLKSTRRAFQVPSRKPLGTACPAATAR
jgi:hypothetical protein